MEIFSGPDKYPGFLMQNYRHNVHTMFNLRFVPLILFKRNRREGPVARPKRGLLSR